MSEENAKESSNNAQIIVLSLGISILFFYLSEKGSHYVILADLELIDIYLPLPPEC